MKKIYSLITIILFSCSANAYADFSGSLTYASDYIWRGVSQTQNKPAIQGNLTYDIFDSGFYLNLFGSNVDFGEDSSALYEFDYAAGYSHDFNQDWNIDLGITDYTYPNASENNYAEGYFNLGYKFLTANFTYSDNTFNTGTDGYYYGLTAKHELFENNKYQYLQKLYLTGHAGYFQKNEDVDGGCYSDYLISLSKEIAKLNLELGWTDTHGRDVNDGLDDSRIYFAVSLNFGKTDE